MSRPKGNTPYEIFGFSTGEPVTARADKHIKNQYCKYLKSECTKFRKSEPNIKIGSCSLGFKNEPVIICPERFKVPTMFETIERKYFPEKNVSWVSEVSLGNRGVVDFVATVLNGNQSLDDFLCVEIQANGTTGTPWGAVNHWRTHHTLEGAPKIKYGFNWANEFTKTLTQQLFKKGTLLNEWNKKLVVVIQDLSMDYIMKQGKGISSYDPQLPIQFHPFKLEYKRGKWVMVESSILYSASIDGIIQSLTSEGSEITSKHDFERLIMEKAVKQGVW